MALVMTKLMQIALVSLRFFFVSLEKIMVDVIQYLIIRL